MALWKQKISHQRFFKWLPGARLLCFQWANIQDVILFNVFCVSNNKLRYVNDKIIQWYLLVQTHESPCQSYSWMGPFVVRALKLGINEFNRILESIRIVSKAIYNTINDMDTANVSITLRTYVTDVLVIVFLSHSRCYCCTVCDRHNTTQSFCNNQNLVYLDICQWLE